MSRLLLQVVTILSTFHAFIVVAADNGDDDDDDDYVVIPRNHTGDSEDESFNPFENVVDDLMNLPWWEELIMFLVISAAFVAVCRRCHALHTNQTHQLLAQHDDDDGGDDDMELIERNKKKKKNKYNPHDPLKELKMAVEFLEKRAQQGALKKKNKAAARKNNNTKTTGLQNDTVARMPTEYKDDPLAV